MAASETAMTRQRARRQALRAVSRITFTFGALGCVEPAPLDEPAGGGGAGGEAWGDGMVGGELDDMALDDMAFDGARDGMTADGGGLDAGLDDADAGWDRDAQIEWVAEDAWVDEADVGGDPSAPDGAAVADAGPGGADALPPCPGIGSDPEGWEACCAERNWDPALDPACFAWGPPMPPSMVAQVMVAQVMTAPSAAASAVAAESAPSRAAPSIVTHCGSSTIVDRAAPPEGVS